MNRPIDANDNANELSGSAPDMSIVPPRPQLPQSATCIPTFKDIDLFLTQHDYTQAIHHLKAYLENHAKDVTALNCLADCYLWQSDYQQALHIYHQLIEIDDRQDTVYVKLGQLYQRFDESSKATHCLYKAIGINPINNIAYVSLGELYDESGQHDLAKELYLHANQLDSEAYHANYHLGVSYHQGHEWHLAVEHLRKARLYEKCNASLEQYLAEALSHCGQWQEVISQLTATDDVFADSPWKHFLLAQAYYELGDAKNAKKHCLLLNQVSPSQVAGHCLLGHLFLREDMWPSAQEAFAKAYDIAPNNIEALACHGYDAKLGANWADCHDITHKLKKLVNQAIDNHQDIKQAAFLIEHYFADDLITQRRLVEYCWEQMGQVSPISFQTQNHNHAQLRVAYIVSNLQRHPQAQTFLAQLKQYSSSNCDVRIYHYRSKETSLQILENCPYAIKELSNESYETTANEIFADNIDILIDLCGSMFCDAPQVLLLHPATVQCQLLGSMHVSAKKAYDAIISSEHQIPQHISMHFAEKIVTVSIPPIAANETSILSNSEIISRESLSIAEDQFIFACWQPQVEIDEESFSTWMSLLSEVPNSVLWLLTDKDSAIRRLQDFAIKYRIRSNRLIIRSMTPQQRMATLTLPNLFLDSFIHSASSAHLKAYIAKRPVLTLIGDYPATRFNYALAMHIDETLIAKNRQDYLNKGIEYAMNRHKQQELTKNRRRSNSEINDIDRYFHELEAHYLTLHSKSK